MNLLYCQPIGHFVGPHSEKYMTPRQSELAFSGEGKIRLNAGCNYEQALEDLAGFEHIWLIYWFHRNQAWKPKVLTPRGGQKRGVFATRSPHRPNPIGLSCVKLIGVKGREIYVGKNDILDETPILDIKPYLVYADAFPASLQGWTEKAPLKESYQLEWSALAHAQASFIKEHSHGTYHLLESAELRLRTQPLPFPNYRIKHLQGDHYEWAFKTWRIIYSVIEQRVFVHEIYSGYDEETLQGKKTSRWDDVELHQKFLMCFNEV